MPTVQPDAAPAPVSQQGVDISNYTAAKAAGSVVVVKGVAGNFVLQQVRYDPVSGKASTPVVANVNLADIDDLTAKLTANKAAIDASLAQLAALRADMVALP